MVTDRESITAKLCAFARAWHSYHSRDKIYDDYLAFDLLGKEEYESVYRQILDGLIDSQKLMKEQAEQVIGEYLAPIPLSRILFSEERLLRFAGEHKRIQYVILGAGGDTFGFRNDNPDIEIYEVDHPDTQRYKLDRIRELEWVIPANVHHVAVDFERERMHEKLLEAGFDPEVKSFFSILGVTYYLTMEQLSNTLEEISALSIRGNELVFDYPIKGEDFPGRVEQLEKLTASLGEEMCQGFEHYQIHCMLCRCGFQIRTFYWPHQVQAVYFDGKKDRLRAFENVSLIAARCL
ncbi:MAG: class I SAM-dependent methyltransferase [Lachnospiraceae bacterium]|nr:class I SAM-dependent methyltransferase [Lachnospiraceae bacterium]